MEGKFGAAPAAVQLALIVISPLLGAAGGWLRLRQQAHGGYPRGRHSHA